jgi:hypothetical protein
MYVYKRTEPGLFTVGYYDPDGKFYPEMDLPEKDEAAKRVHYLNGGVNPELFGQVISELYAVAANINFLVEDLNQRLDRKSSPV